MAGVATASGRVSIQLLVAHDSQAEQNRQRKHRHKNLSIISFVD